MTSRNGTPTAKERLWAAHFVTDPDRNATEAARQAGYAHPKIEGHRLRHRPHVKAMVAHLEAEARKLLKIKKPKKVRAEVLPPPKPGQHSPGEQARDVSPGVMANVSLEQRAEVAEDHAVVSRAEALAVATNIIRTHESKTVGDLFLPADPKSPDGNLVMAGSKVRALPLTAVKGLKHDAAGDLELKLADPLAAARLILDDARRAREGEGAVDLASALIEVLRGSIEARAQERLPEGR